VHNYYLGQLGSNSLVATRAFRQFRMKNGFLLSRKRVYTHGLHDFLFR
jgi:hypothetical protein